MERERALQLVRKHIKNPNLVNHTLAVEAIMGGLARHFGEDGELWGLVGLLHDIDYTLTENEPERHTLVAGEMLTGLVPEEVIRAIQAHNHEHTGVKPETRMEKALIAADAVSGLLIACALVQPSKRLADVKVKSVKKKFKAKDFARNVSRERILYCEEIGLERGEFFAIALESLQRIAGEIGL
ncbi:MAG: HDIG domain-containing protein [Euryarchaeota archaeon]|nr:HDIG domain-containing protein [Euryarchaeota archaeon]